MAKINDSGYVEKTTLDTADQVYVLDSGVTDPTTTQGLKWISPKNLGIQLKGYKEYTFAIRQSGTDAPTISVIKDDFEVTSLVATYSDVGRYSVDTSTLGLTLGLMTNLIYTPTNESFSDQEASVGLIEDSLQIFTKADDSYANGVLADGFGMIISIRETLEDT